MIPTRNRLLVITLALALSVAPLASEANEPSSAESGTTHLLGVSKDGSGGGTVTSDIDGIDCGEFCSVRLAEGAYVVLTATAAKDSTFTGWSGRCSASAALCELSLNEDKLVTANFDFTTQPEASQEPTDGTIAWGETVSWKGGPLTGDRITGAVVVFGGECIEGMCDEFLLDVELAPSPSPAQIRFVEINVAASDPDAAMLIVIPPGGVPPRDFVVYEGDRARLLDPDPGVWTIRVACFNTCEET